VINASEWAVRFILLDDTGERSLVRAGAFELVSGEIPSSWCVITGDPGSTELVHIGPGAWTGDNFFSDLDGDDEDAGTIAAREIFQRELAIMLQEST
jgi:hypothetical protein